MKTIYALIVMFAVVFFTPASEVRAQIKLPSYAQGQDVKQQVDTKGKYITEVVALIVAIIGIICLLIAAGFAMAANADRAKQFFFGSVAGFIIAATAYGIAASMAK